MYCAVNSPRIVHEFMDAEVVAIDFETGCYYSLQGIAAAIWCLLDAGLSRDDVVARLVNAFPAHAAVIAADVAGFIEQLQANGLMVHAAARPAREVSIILPAFYHPPALERFTDMEQLLLLDPIHEVDEVAGWPVKK